ncbi:hypothetical protein OIU74_006781 [Salix koriyanagi]|uniref:Uncharacterized protein n=1 Tax=Salix koriyanagi TaxID=2511006 RepID=A0A9Q0UEZ5_9ROSI|nr:hypothetical protein OIU74_006781 [Salix koriyanagi]
MTCKYPQTTHGEHTNTSWVGPFGLSAFKWHGGGCCRGLTRRLRRGTDVVGRPNRGLLLWSPVEGETKMEAGRRRQTWKERVKRGWPSWLLQLDDGEKKRDHRSAVADGCRGKGF